eukprot:CAMPEP_0198648016 /NCGR_PEP_ID=MMETSP1467-20131203/3184_2 /TAXON_ID=1462469 /ORGANISM="unid. sp., Strain CCMP2135" /LENGTH=49 /DNA_ID=CAMNT_0044383699 /DNA_START=166 /DNA_END=315 /DNA_ORIENTATION=-
MSRHFGTVDSGGLRSLTTSRTASSGAMFAKAPNTRRKSSESFCLTGIPK